MFVGTNNRCSGQGGTVSTYSDRTPRHHNRAKKRGLKVSEDFLHSVRTVVSKSLKSQSHGYYIMAKAVTNKT